MTKFKKLISQILSGTSDANISFNKIRALIQYLGFKERINGSHHIYSRDDIEEILNIQPKYNKAKSYQVKQIRNIILKYKLGDKQDEQI
ncbi:type II toxin-antitoxin system HicA family toxin [Candidatus Magnetobacterium casense]|uniref:type II toxin-antitoxin system HicA family toxin n=1 Tax=Candidatus Magnetobacterium casense TaxID=1455061 RepID=UPI00058FD0D4|nr:type II toxin-antitoxin system HicA family toxin [Candidatus Magnetobacterium casensis]